MEKEGSNLYNNLTKKETQTINREKVKLADQHRGIKDMRRLPDAVLVVDAQYENTAIREAKRLDIPVIAIVDSNTDLKKLIILFRPMMILSGPYNWSSQCLPMLSMKPRE